MSETIAAAAKDPREEVSLLSIVGVMIKWRKLILLLGFGLGILGLLVGLTSERVYMATATFVPQGPVAAQSGLAAAASQFGLALPKEGAGAWTAAMYVELIRFPSLLAPIVLDSVSVQELGGRRISYVELLQVNRESTAERNVVRAIESLRKIILTAEEKRLGGVRVSVTTPYPSVSLDLAQRLMKRIDDFSLATKRGQASSERVFVEGQAREAERRLNEVEEELEDFLRRNRALGDSPELRFRRNRLERMVSIRQAELTGLLQSVAESRIQEVRDTPSILILEPPKLPFVPEPRRSAQKAILGGLIGGIIALFIAFGAEGIARLRENDSPEVRRFMALVRESFPRREV